MASHGSYLLRLKLGLYLVFPVDGRCCSWHQPAWNWGRSNIIGVYAASRLLSNQIWVIVIPSWRGWTLSRIPCFRTSVPLFLMWNDLLVARITNTRHSARVIIGLQLCFVAAVFYSQLTLSLFVIINGFDIWTFSLFHIRIQWRLSIRGGQCRVLSAQLIILLSRVYAASFFLKPNVIFILLVLDKLLKHMWFLKLFWLVIAVL